MLCAYLAALEPLVDTLEASGFPALLPAYTARSCTLGSRVQVSGGMELTGLAESLDASGALMVRTMPGTAPGAVRRCFRAGDHGLCVRDWGWICAEFPAWRHF